jgi:16S rRNA (guanine(966)-N(2))-methyltransferase RsmD
MRIVSGKYRGMKLAEFEGRDVRPTADRVKESLFNILSGDIVGAKVLDLFCGSGNLGIECLSRGASEVYFNDISKESIALLNKNLARMRDEKFFVSNLDFAVCLDRYRQKFDLIFIDPPYKLEAGAEALKIIGSKGLLDGIAVYERDRAFEGSVEGLELFDERKYGKTYLSFFKKA